MGRGKAAGEGGKEVGEKGNGMGKYRPHGHF